MERCSPAGRENTHRHAHTDPVFILLDVCDMLQKRLRQTHRLQYKWVDIRCQMPRCLMNTLHVPIFKEEQQFMATGN